jgi:hypothetical protein
MEDHPAAQTLNCVFDQQVLVGHLQTEEHLVMTTAAVTVGLIGVMLLRASVTGSQHARPSRDHQSHRQPQVL